MSTSQVGLRESQDVVEVLHALITRSPTTITGVGISQDVVEVIAAYDGTSARIAQDVIEVIYSAGGGTPPTGDGGAATPVTRTFGYAV
jgi:hypothetical protein